MAKFSHYSPQISRFLVSVLYHEAKSRKIPMTKLTDQLLRDALVESSGWKHVEALRSVASTPPAIPQSAA